jgi:putative transposase
VLTEATGHVHLDVPRDREGSFDPVIVNKRHRRLNGVDEIVLSLYAQGMTQRCPASCWQVGPGAR